MEAYILKAQISRFMGTIIEDHVYYIEYFKVTVAKEQYCAVHHHLQARFTGWTKVREVLPVPQGFPLFAYKLCTFQQILSRIEDKTYLASRYKKLLLSSLLTKYISQDAFFGP